MQKKNPDGNNKRLANLSLSYTAPLTTNQSILFHNWDKYPFIILSGCAGTGKTFIALYKALEEALEEKQRDVVVVRNNAAIRDPGHLPGDIEEKNAIYEAPYKAICNRLLRRGDGYERLKEQKYLRFISTSFIRGITLDDSIIIVDEFQNLNFHEIDSIITRVGKNSKIVFSGDISQTDLYRKNDVSGFDKFMKIAENMSVLHIPFQIEDIVRSGLVREYIIAKEKLENG